MAQVQFYRVTASQLTNLAKKDGQLIFTTDTHKLYLDNGIARIQIEGIDFTYGLSLDGQKITITKNGGKNSIDLPIATTTNAGLLSIEDKKKLDGVAEGANKIVVDSALSSTSMNPLQNKVIFSALEDKLSTSLKGAKNGLAELDEKGIIVTSQLPSYVDDVLEFDTRANLPETGETGKIYVALDTNLTYRWSGSDYVEISPSIALGETSSTAYRGDRGALAYKHAVTNKGAAFENGLYKITTNEEGHVISATLVSKEDITKLGIPSENTTYTAGDNVTISDNKISATDTKYTAGDNIIISEDNVISATSSGLYYSIVES